MLRGYILVELSNGKNIKYVRDVVVRGDPKNYYAYGDTKGDTYGYTSDTVGRIKFDYLNLKNIYLSKKALPYPSFMTWPESTGDTEALTRTNKENATIPIRMNAFSDTFFYRLLPKTRMSLETSQISGITIIEERVTQWYKANSSGSYSLVGSNM